MFIDSGRILCVLGKDPPFTTIRENLKLIKLEINGKKLISKGWRRTKQVWEES